jgi:cardiolipin synthase
VVLAIGGTTDWVDGFLARRLGQVSRLGELMDPLADRLYILATLLAFTIGGVVPWVFTAFLLLRDLVLLVCVGVLKRYGYGPLPVHYVGKAATAQLLLAFPILLLATVTSGTLSTWAHALGWGLAWWGIVFYWISAGLYLVQAAGLIRAARRMAPA